MDDQIINEISPIIVDIVVAVVVAILGLVAAKANELLKAKTTEQQYDFLRERIGEMMNQVEKKAIDGKDKKAKVVEMIEARYGDRLKKYGITPKTISTIIESLHTELGLDHSSEPIQVSEPPMRSTAVVNDMESEYMRNRYNNRTHVS